MRSAAILFLFSAFITSAKAQTDPVIRSVLAEWKQEQKQNDSLINGVPAFPLGRFREQDLLQHGAFLEQEVKKLENLSDSELSPADRINRDLLLYNLSQELLPIQYKDYLNPVTSEGGFHTSVLFRIPATITSATAAAGYIALLKTIPAYFDENIRFMKKGLQMGISQPRAALQGFEATYQAPLVDSVEQSVFWKPFLNKPATISDSDWQTIVAEAKAVINSKVLPSYRSLKTFFETTYFPQTRQTLSASAEPNGKEHYAALVKFHTTTNMSPDEVFELGTKEVSRIRGQMDSVIKAVGFKGRFADFLTFLRTDPQFFVTTPDQLLKEASFIAKEIDGQLPRLFGRLPRLPYGVAPVPDFLAPSYTSGRAYTGSVKNHRAGMYWVNTYNLQSRTLYTLEALTLHEAVPGHLLQTALAQELTSLPEFRQDLYINAFGEGWGLYSEYLGTELGLYKTPFNLFGRLTYEMWRACRLVIDVGIHWKGWTREQAVAFLANNTALSLHEVNTEVNRYITWPGQALAYKIGELKFKELRQKAEAELGDRFDVREFHDLVLSEGSVTLNILTEMVNSYIDAKKNRANNTNSKQRHS